MIGSLFKIRSVAAANCSGGWDCFDFGLYDDLSLELLVAVGSQARPNLMLQAYVAGVTHPTTHPSKFIFLIVESVRVVTAISNFDRSNYDHSRM